jgi:LDH2 family malate/lactate/ureidoglycolate dehydrogenase
MLERFKVPEQDQVRVTEQSLRRTVTAIFETVGLSHDDAAEGADVLVMADLRGVESHGVSNELRHYVQMYGDGLLNPTPQVRIDREWPGTATIDADQGLGIVMGRRVMQMAIDKAKEVGFGAVTMHNSGHLGAVGHFAMIAAQQDMVGMCTTSGGTIMAPTFAAESRFGTNPISVAAPTGSEPPFLYDAATTSVAINKVILLKRLGVDVHPGWITDKEGTPVMDERPVPELGEYSLLPLGSTRELGSHKGYGLATIVEILGSLLSGNLPTMVGGYAPGAPHRNFFAAFDIAAFSDVDEFKNNMDETLRTLRESPPAPGHERVLYPGLAEYETEQERRANGIPLHREVVGWFESMVEERGVPRLEPR